MAIMMGLLAAVAAGLTVLAVLAHSVLIVVAVASVVAVAAGLTGYINASGSIGSGASKTNLSMYSSTWLDLLRRHRRNTSRQPKFVLVTTTPAENHRSSPREAIDALGRTNVRDALNALNESARQFKKNATCSASFKI